MGLAKRATDDDSAIIVVKIEHSHGSGFVSRSLFLL